MSPIEGVSNIRRMPRLGKVRLGIKIEEEGKNPYPRSTDYFVVPDEIKRALDDEKPRRLPIMFPTENVEEFAQQWLRCYSFTQGLICISDDSEILTNRGWLGIEELKEGDIAVTMDLATGVYTEQPVEIKIVFDFKGDLLNFHTRSLDALLTPDHRVIYRQTKIQPWKVSPADQVHSNISWPAVGPVNKTDMPISDDLLSILGWIIPEGTQMNSNWARSHHGPSIGNNRLTPEERAKRASYLTISQSKHPFVEEIAELLQRLFGRVNKSTVKNCGGPGNREKEVLPSTRFFLGASESNACRHYLGESIHRIPRDILNNASPRQLKILLTSLLKANGSHSENHGTRYYAGKNRGQADDVQEICTRTGLRSSINPGSRHPNTIGQFWLQVSPEWKTSHTIKRNPIRVPCESRVWCITTLNGTFVARRRGRVFTTGNCKGDGQTAIRKVDTDTGAIASHTTREWAFSECTCDPKTCPESVGDQERGIKPQCRKVMNLLFLLPDVPGFGVWQLDTSSFYSIININSCIDLIKKICRRISFIPLTLALEPMEVSPPGIKKKTVQILYIRSDLRLAQIQKLGQVPPEKVLLPTLEEEEAPEDLFPWETLVEAEEDKQEEQGLPPEPETKTPEDVVQEDTPDLSAVFRLCFHFYKMQPVDICRELGYGSTTDALSAQLNPWDSWLTIKLIKQPQKE